jgi:hypothetical protein
MKRNALLVKSNPSKLAGFNEDKDCTVRALCTAGNISYAKAHEIARKRGRENGKPFNTFTLVAASATYGLVWNLLRYKGSELDGVVVSGGSVATFAKTHPRGRYIVYASKHAIAVVNGKIHDTWDSSKKHLKCAWRLIE